MAKSECLVGAIVEFRNIRVSEKVAWVRLDDGLPQHPEGIPS